MITNCATTLDFYFVNKSGLGQFRERGKVPYEFIFKPYPEGLGLTHEEMGDKTINSDNITVFFVSNTAADKIPMTAWTIVHRVGHAMNRTPQFQDYTKWLDNEFDELPHSIISSPIVSEPGSLCTDTHLLVRVFKNNPEAENFNCYMKTKFFRFMMLLAKNNQNMSKDVFQFVPLQNFDKKWSDKQLYSKYKLSAEEINFIESVIKERN